MSKKTKYKLLKDIPGYKAGSTVTIVNGEAFFDSSGDSGYGMSEKIIKEHPEWFEEVEKWPKRWENVRFASYGFDTFGQPPLRVYSHHSSYKSIVARLKLEAIAKQMNDGWEPDWAASEYKYFVYLQGKNLNISNTWTNKTHIVFKTREMVKFSLEHHRKLWEDYWMINE